MQKYIYYLLTSNLFWLIILLCRKGRYNSSQREAWNLESGITGTRYPVGTKNNFK